MSSGDCWDSWTTGGPAVRGHAWKAGISCHFLPTFLCLQQFLGVLPLQSTYLPVTDINGHTQNVFANDPNTAGVVFLTLMFKLEGPHRIAGADLTPFILESEEYIHICGGNKKRERFFTCACGTVTSCESLFASLVLSS